MKTPGIFLTLFLLLASPLHAAPSTTVGVLDTSRIMQESKRMKTRVAAYNQWAKTQKESLDAIVAELKQMQETLASPHLGEERREKVTMQLQEKQAEMKRQMEAVQTEQVIRQQRELREFGKELRPLIDAVAEREGIELLLDTASTTGILFVDKSIDITDKVLKLYDAER